MHGIATTLTVISIVVGLIAVAEIALITWAFRHRRED